MGTTIALGSEINGSPRRENDWSIQWYGANAKCEDKGPLTPCDTCSCTLLQQFQGVNFNKCTKKTKQCFHWNLHCVDSVKKEGECCPTCPNGITCRIYGQVVSVGETKYKNPVNDKETSQCV